MHGVETCGTIVGMGRVVDLPAGRAVDVWVVRMAEVMAVWAVEVWVAVANGDRDARWVHNIATSCGFLPHDGRPRSRAKHNHRRFQGHIQIN